MNARGTYQVKNDLGLHARAATKLVQLASKYPCDVQLAHQGQSANAKSVMGVLLLCGSKGTRKNDRPSAPGLGAAERADRPSSGSSLGERPSGSGIPSAPGSMPAAP